MKTRSCLFIPAVILLLLSSCDKSSDIEKETVTDTIKVYDTIRTDEVDRPVHLMASKGSFGNRISISWTPMPNAKLYQLYKFNETTKNYALLAETADTIYTDLSAHKAFTKAYYKVMVRNSASQYSRFSDVDYGYTSGQNYSRSHSFGYEGTAPGLIGLGLHLQVDTEENIYVTDVYQNRVHKFDKNGVFKEIFFEGGTGARGMAFLANGNSVVTRTQSGPYIEIRNQNKEVIKGWGSYGTGNSQFGNIEEIAVDDEQHIYVVDGINNSIKKFDQNGNFLLKWVATVRTPNQNDGPYPFGICIFKNKVFVTSPRNGIIRVYDLNGNFIKSWDSGSIGNAIKAHGDYLYIACDGFIMKTDENGEVREQIGKGQLGIITGLAVNKSGDIIVSEIYTRKIITYKQL